MHLFLKYHHHQFHKLFHTDFWHFELSVWTHCLAQSMISIFVPIFLLRMGFSLGEVMLYYLVYNIIDAPLNFFAKWLIYKIGARKVIIIGTLFYMGFFVVLYNLNYGEWGLFILLALLAAMYDVLYYVAHIYYFMKCEKSRRNVSRGVSLLHIARQIAGILAPIAGAVILIFFERQILIIISFILLGISIWPLFLIKHSKDRPSKKPKSIFKYFKKGDGLREYIVQSLYAFHATAESTLWPIFIYTLFKSIEAVAAIPVILSLSTAIFIFFVGKIKKANRSRIMTIGSLLIALTWIMRIYFQNNIFYYITVFMIGMFSVLVVLPLESNIYEKGEKKDALTTSTHRNFFSMAPRIFIFALLYVSVEVFKVSFITAILSMLIIMAISYLITIKKPVGFFRRAY